MNPRQLGLPQTTDPAQALEAFLRGLQGAHDPDVKRIGAYGFHHGQVVDTRIMGQGDHRRVAVAPALGNEHRGQLAANLHMLQHHALQHLLTGITEDHLEPQADPKLGARLRHAGVAGEQQPLSRPDTQPHPIDFALDAWPVLAVDQQAASTALQVDFTDQPALAQ